MKVIQYPQVVLKTSIQNKYQAPSHIMLSKIEVNRPLFSLRVASEKKAPVIFLILTFALQFFDEKWGVDFAETWVSFDKFFEVKKCDTQTHQLSAQGALFYRIGMFLPSMNKGYFETACKLCQAMKMKHK